MTARTKYLMIAGKPDYKGEEKHIRIKTGWRTKKTTWHYIQHRGNTRTYDSSDNQNKVFNDVKITGLEN